ncbi:carboxymuconolactone decarboxylase family protein [Nannocystis punicea]|uniref:Carboxymuconolactone decarboxylase family protein n=1 Tax=Nannocystis punicea TaxID=2995304 RepID=A0ABY7H1Y0_9BACT|nr:carboxymuconolactone decarboxylase family protein [Nannocystis poenicansa]WAS93137.1 carboxymuconolactone decarboxylase family protein [Nannocystis poenicansa]
MARLPYVNIDELPEELRASLGRLPPLNIYRLLAHTPNALQVLALTTANLYQAEIDQRLRELAILRVAHLTNSRYEWVQHATFAQSLGVSATQVEAISRGADAEVFTEVERLVLRFTDEMTENVKVSASTFQSLAQHLNPRCLMELALAVGMYGMLARIMETFEVELEPTAGTYTFDSGRQGAAGLLKGSG